MEIAEISPPQLSSIAFSTFLGGITGATLGEAIAVDQRGFVYVAGRTQSPDFPVVNPAQGKYGGDANDAFVARLTADGQRILFATFLGGGDADWAEGIAVDDEGNVYVTGTTYSRNFPTTPGALQRKFGGGDRDGFVAKLSPAGVLIYATYLGGDSTDRLMAVAIDRTGNAYVTGSTNSKRFVPQHEAGRPASIRNWDVIAAKLNPAGSELIYSVRFGGTAGVEPRHGQIGGESGTAIAVDSRGRTYVAGYTDSGDFPMPRRIGSTGGGDAFVAMLGETGTILDGLSLGGNGKDSGVALALDSAGAVYLTGETMSNDFPVQPSGQARPAPRALGNWGFLTKMQAGLAGIDYSVYFRSANSFVEPVSDIVVDRTGNVYGTGNGYLIVLGPTGSVTLTAGLGGIPTAEGRGIALDSAGNIHVSGTVMMGGPWAFPLVRALQTNRGRAHSQSFITKRMVRSQLSTPSSATLPNPTFTPPAADIGVEFVRIPPGTFQMGYASNAREVRITKAFEMGKYEITQAQWQAVMATVMGPNPSSFKGETRPVEEVSWEDVQQYISSLNARRDGYRYRLPTEAEWEYAARAGMSDLELPWNAISWHDGNSGRQTHPVGQKQATPWGLHDMYGNVREWVQDTRLMDPSRPASGVLGVLCGGSWVSSTGRLSASSHLGANLRSSDVGFRLVREAIP